MISRYESSVCFISFRALILFLFSFLTCEGTGKLQNSEQWEEAIVAFESQDRKSPPSSGGVLFIGSSTIRKCDSLSEDFPNKNVINRGFGGSKIPDSIKTEIIDPYSGDGKMESAIKYAKQEVKNEIGDMLEEILDMDEKEILAEIKRSKNG